MAVACDPSHQLVNQHHHERKQASGIFFLSSRSRLSTGRRIIKCKLSQSESGSPSKRPVSLSTFREEPFILREGGGGGGDKGNGHAGGGGGGSRGSSGWDQEGEKRRGGLLGAFFKGWEDRVKLDPQFPFKVLMEEVVGVGANVLGDMASRPNFGLNELDFVFSTIVVGSIVNFTLMYMLAPSGSTTSSSSRLFAGCPTGHMFEPGAYTLVERAGTFITKGTAFAGVGFAAGLVGTVLSTMLLNVRKKMDPKFIMNKPPPTILNAATWALHMGLSANLRYQALNGIEFKLAQTLSPAAFKISVLVTRALNNLVGGYSFVNLARVTGSQRSAA